MATGTTYTGSLADALPIIVDQARTTREYPGVMTKCVDRQTLSEGEGTKWDEFQLAALAAQTGTELTTFDNPQQVSGTLWSLEPTLTCISTVITKRTMARISKNVAAQIGKLAQEAIERKKDEDGLTLLDSGTSLCGTGTTLTSGHIAAAARRISGNVTEPMLGPIYTVLHPYQLKDIQDEVVAGVGTYAIPAGLTEDYFKSGFSGSLWGTNVFEDGNIVIDGTPDAKGGVFAKNAIVLVQGFSPYTLTKELPELGGGATQVWLYDEYIYGERTSALTSVGLYEIFSDATAPTS